MTYNIYCPHCLAFTATVCDVPDLFYCRQCHRSDKIIRTISTPGIVIGDIVQLKSGSIKMTVCTIEDGHAHCRWYDSDFQFIRLPLAALVKI